MTTLMTDRPKDTATERDPRWASVVGRDGAADGIFWYSVATTGVYCRPSCPSRTANPQNVRFPRHDPGRGGGRLSSPASVASPISRRPTSKTPKRWHASAA